MPGEPAIDADTRFRILAAVQGRWGGRIAAHLKSHAPEDWRVEIWKAPSALPPIIDYPEDFLPPSLPEVDLVLSLGDVSGLAQLIPDIVRETQARAVIAPIDRNSALPSGLARQLEKWLEGMGAGAAFPKPFCSLTETHYNRTPIRVEYDGPLIRRFARAFGEPKFRAVVEEGKIASLQVLRDSACGCASYVAENLIGNGVEGAIGEAGMLHHHFPCLADMQQDRHYRDTLMHVSGNILKDRLKDELRDDVSESLIRPHGYVDHAS
jgi:hypothetical protein